MKYYAIALVLALAACRDETNVANDFNEAGSSVTVTLPTATTNNTAEPKRNAVGEVEGADDGFNVGETEEAPQRVRLPG